MARADIKLGYSCNDACVHCVVDDFRDLLRHQGLHQDKTTEQFMQELTESRARTDTIVFTGGEPSIRRDLVELLRHARDLGYRIQMQSNGRRFADHDFVDSVVETACIDYCIALHGPSAAVHDAVTRRRGAFNETVQGIKNLMARAQTVSAKIVLSRINMRHVPETVETLRDLGVRYVSIAFPHALGTARKLWDEVVPCYAEVIPYVRRALDIALRDGLGADVETFPFCLMEGYEGFVSELRQQLEDYVELRQYGGDQTLLDWTTVRRDIKRKFPQCGGCRFDAICEGPWMEYADRLGGDEFRPRYGEPVRRPQDVLDGSFRAHSAALDGLGPLLPRS